jgi:alkanesulfonate monooxygenase SsuD/methylene tetrahydromethanopterin reductase-like flavin-dependent oxidoreductase (luciferase family)
MGAVTGRPFRFGVMAVPRDRQQWLGVARRAEQLGFSTLLVPDGLRGLSPLPALALAAGATTELRVGTFVLAAPLRPARLAAWDAHTLTVLTDGRFDLGIGTGLPEAAEQGAEALGQPVLPPARRLDQALRTIEQLRELDGPTHTPVLMAARGPRAIAAAAAHADMVTLATGPLADRAEAARMADQLRAAAGDRAGQVELVLNVFVVGDEVPPWIQGFLGADAATLIERDSLVMLRGSVSDMADELRRRGDEIGISYVIVNAAYMEQLAPVARLLGA